MNNLEFLLMNQNIHQYTTTEMMDILTKECELNGEDLQLTICMEEFAELVEVIVDYNIRGRLDKLHLKEEICDCYLCLEKLCIIYNINSEKIEYDYCKYTDTNYINNCILNLVTSIQKLSKCVRKKENANAKIITIINLIGETLFNIKSYFNILDEELVNIINLKIARSEDRNSKRISQMNIELLDDDTK